MPDTPAFHDSAQVGMKDQMLGEFRLLRRLGRGGMAEVYLAEQTSLKRQVAVKILRADKLAESADVLLKRFEQEGKAAAGLNHPNIVQVYSVGEENGVHYIAQEYVQGQTLRQYLARKGPPDVAVAMHVMKQVAAALGAAAEAGIVHRDIKPENIMLTRKGKVKVADFGLARLMQERERVDLTQVGVTMGTPTYMSPEQINGSEIDQRSDIYSFGVTCYHMLAGNPPFRGETAMSVAVQHVSQQPEPLDEVRPDLPKVLCEIIHKMMAKQPDNRYPDAQSVLNDLRLLATVLRQQPDAVAELSLSQFESAVDGSQRTRRQRFADWAGKRQLLLFVVSFLLVGSASAGVGWWLRPRDPFKTPARAESKIPPRASAAAQFMLAMRMRDNVDAWKAVREHFPSASLEIRRAEEQLAVLYIRNRRFDKAKELFEQFALMGSEDPALQAKGYAGLAVIASLMGDYKESQRIIAVDLRPAMERLPRPREFDPEMYVLMGETLRRNERQLGEQIKNDIRELFRPTTTEDGLPVIEE